MNWNKQHDKFALSCRLSESDALVLRDAMSKAKPHEPIEIEMDLRVTNRWIGKVRPKGEYHRKTITGTIVRLEEKTQGMITIIKKYSPWVYKILVRPLSFVQRIQSALCASMPKLRTIESMFDSDHKKRSREQQQQNISRLRTLLQGVGLNYSDDALLRLWRYSGKSLEYTKDAVEYMLTCHHEKLERSQDTVIDGGGISKPHGWLHDCLKYGWHYQPEPEFLPMFNERGEITNFVDGILKLVQDCRSLKKPLILD